MFIKKIIHAYKIYVQIYYQQMEQRVLIDTRDHRKA